MVALGGIVKADGERTKKAVVELPRVLAELVKGLFGWASLIIIVGILVSLVAVPILAIPFLLLLIL
jgi:hypothetical protein